MPYARVCETHIGLGLLASEIIRQNLPLPEIDMMPVSIEEKIVCIADKFFSKDKNISVEKSFEQVQRQVSSWGERPAATFDSWIKELHIQ
jgi:uncharacterized protein